MFVQLGYGYPFGLAPTLQPPAISQASASGAAASSHAVANPTNATANAGASAGAGAAPAQFPGFAAHPGAAYLGSQGYLSPFGLTAGGAAASAAQSGHQVSNPTNALVPGNGAAANPYQSAIGPALLAPGYVGVAVPVVFALPVFAAYLPQPAPVAQTPGGAEPPAPAPAPAVANPPLPEPVSPEPIEPVTVQPIDVVPTPDETDEPPPVVVKPVTNAELANYQQTRIESSLTTELTLSLTTLEGDEISLDFSSLDVLRSNRVAGEGLDGADVLRESDGEEIERLVNMNVDGDLSAAESAAIDELLGGIAEVAQAFFSGAMNEAVDQLRNLDFDTATLSELSLRMSMTQKTVTNSGYRDAPDALDQLTAGGGEVLQALDFLASEQRRLIEQAQEIFDDESAVRAVTSLLPPLLENPAALDALEKLESNLEAGAL